MSPLLSKVLIVDSDADALAPLVYEFARRSYRVQTASNADEALEAVSSSPPDLILMSTELPGATGLSLLRSIRSAAETERLLVIVLTSSNDPEERVLAFRAGADDGLSRPVNPEEVLLRAEVLLRRSGEVLPPSPRGILKVGPLQIDDAAKGVYLHGEDVGLPPTEYRLLLALARRRGRVQSREELRQLVWGDEVISLRAVDNKVTELRKRLGQARDWIESVRGHGYRLRAEG